MKIPADVPLRAPGTAVRVTAACLVRCQRRRKPRLTAA